MTVLFFLMDVIPDYVQKTFGVDEHGSIIGGFLLPIEYAVVREGGRIPDNIRQSIIVYNGSLYHYQQTRELLMQIKAINPNVTHVTIPVQG